MCIYNCLFFSLHVKNNLHNKIANKCICFLTGHSHEQPLSLYSYTVFFQFVQPMCKHLCMQINLTIPCHTVHYVDTYTEKTNYKREHPPPPEEQICRLFNFHPIGHHQNLPGGDVVGEGICTKMLLTFTSWRSLIINIFRVYLKGQSSEILIPFFDIYGQAQG